MATSFLSMMEARMPPGFRFHPRDEELINDYLAKKLAGSDSSCPMMVDVDLNKVEPWDLPGEACVGGKEWYFYSLRDRKYATGQRTNRATHSGYWKATGKDRLVQDSSKGGKLVGMRKTLVFYQGRAPKGKKTDWVMHEFRLDSSSTTTPNALSVSTSASASASAKEDWVLCRVFYKSRGLALKPNVLGSASAAASVSDNCYDDTGTSSLPPLMDTFINFQQPHHALQGLPSTDQVPCFSSLFSPSHREPLDNRSFAAFHNISNPFVGAFTGDKRTFGVLDGLVKMEEAGSLAPPPAPPASHDGFLTETGAGRSVWTNAPY